MRSPNTLPIVIVTLLSIGTLVSAATPSGARAQSRCEAPRALIVVDRSSSMSGSRAGYLPSGDSKWGAARRAAFELTATFADRIDFGLALFPSVDGENTCNPGGVVLGVGPHAAADVMGAFPEADPPHGGNWTPTAQTLDVLLDEAELQDDSRDRHVILVTDGQQCCIEGGNCIWDQRFWPVASIMRLRALGVYVHLVGFGSGVDALTLNRSAVAGGTAIPGCDMDGENSASATNCYHQADDLAGLDAALDSIARFITEEVCDGYDNDCDDAVDEDYDYDSDLYTTCGSDVTVPGTPLDDDLVDCDDAAAAINPGAVEVCNGIDDDCDGLVDPGCECQQGDERVCGTHVGVCMEGVQRCEGGAWGMCEGGNHPAAELCDGLDDDCDGSTDESATCDAGEACLEGACRLLVAPEEPPPAPLAEAGGCCTVAAGSKSPRARYALGFAAFIAALAGFRARRRS